MPSKPPTKMRGGRAWPIMRGRCRSHENAERQKILEQFEATPEFVVMFLPGETFSARRWNRSGLIEQECCNGYSRVADHADRAAESRCLRWNQEKLARKRAADQRTRQRIARPPAASRRTYHIGRHRTGPSGRVLQQSGWLARKRVLVSARKFAELGASVVEDIPELAPIETTSRALSFEWDEEDISTDAPQDERKAARLAWTVLGGSRCIRARGSRHR